MTPRPPSGEWFEHQPRLPGPGEPRARGRRAFGETWWGRAWVEALEQRAQLDPNRLPRGRTYARTGAVGVLTLSAGEVMAEVQGSRRQPYRVRVRIRVFDTHQWDAVLDALAAQIGHTAALLDGELPAEVADDVRSVGLDLLPGPGELQPRCTCPDWADPCKHAAAVCYLVADAIDEDPFGALLLRGRGREQVLAGLRARRHVGRPAVPAREVESAADEGVVAREAWSRSSGEMPVAPEPPLRPGRPTVLAADPPPGSGVDLAALRALAADAAARAVALAHGASQTGLELTAEQDLARRAAQLLARPTDGEPRDAPTAPGEAVAIGLADLAARAGKAPRDLLVRALAFRDGGVEGLAVTDGAWDPGSEAMAAGRLLLGSRAVLRRNRATAGDRQVRLGRDGRWYPFRKDRSGTWTPDGPPLIVPADDNFGELDDEALGEI